MVKAEHEYNSTCRSPRSSLWKTHRFRFVQRLGLADHMIHTMLDLFSQVSGFLSTTHTQRQPQLPARYHLNPAPATCLLPPQPNTPLTTTSTQPQLPTRYHLNPTPPPAPPAYQLPTLTHHQHQLPTSIISIHTCHHTLDRSPFRSLLISCFLSFPLTPKSKLSYLMLLSSLCF
jgi:hypothetical protein